MPFGKFHPAESKLITNVYGRQVPLNMPSGYAGLFWGRVYRENGEKISLGSEYFYRLAKTNGEENEFIYWDIIYAEIGKHCKQYVDPYFNEGYHYQYGFGGDESDGVIDFWLPEQIPEMPPLHFTINNEKYVLQWEYSNGDD